MDRIYEPYLDKDTGPRMHPVVTHVAMEWDSAVEQCCAPHLNTLSLSEVADMCNELATEHPQWCAELRTADLTPWLESQDLDFFWWLPMIDASMVPTGECMVRLCMLANASHASCGPCCRF